LNNNEQKLKNIGISHKYLNPTKKKKKIPLRSPSV